MAEPAADRNSTDDALQKEINRREAFERKNAELEGVNDELRVENGELRTQVQVFRKKLEEMAAKPRTGSLSLSPSSSPVAQRKHHLKEPKSKSSPKKRPSSMFAHSSSDNHEVEVHTLRREKEELKDELEETKSKQISFEAAFQTEFDLRTTMEEKYDSLRERYERLVIESDELRKLLRQHNILIPPPPSLRHPKSKNLSSGPEKPPRRTKRSASLQPERSPKSEEEVSRKDNYRSQEHLAVDHERETYSTENIRSLSQNESSSSPTRETSPSIVTHSIQGDKGTSSDNNEKKEDTNTENKEEKEHDVKKAETNGHDTHHSVISSQPSKTPTGDERKKSNSVDDSTNGKNSITPPPSSDNHTQTCSGSTVEVTDTPISKSSNQPIDTQALTGVTITVSTAIESKTGQTTSVVTTQSSIESGLSDVVVNSGGTDTHDAQTESKEHDEIFALSNEAEVEESKVEWELDSLMASSAKQLESAKAFYAQMHAHLKKAQSLDDDSDD